MGFWARTKERIAATRHRLGELWWYAGLMTVVQLVGMLVNFYTGLWLIPRFVPQSELGAIIPLTQLAIFLAIPLGMVMGPFGKFLNTFMARGETGKAKALLVDGLRISLVAAVIMTAYTVAVAPFIQVRMRVPGLWVVMLLCVMAFLNGLKPAIASSTQALKRFDLMMFSSLAGAPLRFVLVWVLAGSLGLFGYLVALCGVDLFALGIGALSLYWLLGPKVRRQSYQEHWGEILAFSAPVIVMTLLCTLAATVEPFVIRQRLPDADSAAYYVITRFSEICGFAGGIVGVLFFPLVSERFERGQSTHRLLSHASVANILFGGLAIGVLIVAGKWILGLRPQWAIYQHFSVQMWQLGLIHVTNILLGTFLAHESACRRFGFGWFSVVVRVGMAVLLYCVTGWGFFRPYLPEGWWNSVANIGAGSLGFIVNFALVGQLIMVVGILVLVRRYHGRLPTGEEAVAS
ncbi:MAG: lipopolysaccharide biosynthesis protein [Kiritimatiellia bacterium]